MADQYNVWTHLISRAVITPEPERCSWQQKELVSRSKKWGAEVLPSRHSTLLIWYAGDVESYI